MPVTWFDLLRERVVPLAGGAGLPPSGLGVALAVAVALILVRPLWRVARLAVTLVHELGHAVVGIAVGRRFDGFVVRGDMSGHALTTGSARGPGRVVTTWAGYPAPALVGAAAVWFAVRGWAAPVLTASLVIVLVSVTRVRSVLTALVVAAALAGVGSLWWWRSDLLQAQVLVGAGLVLVVGGWRHVAAVVGHGTATDDPGVLARLSHLPRAAWNLSFVLVTGLATWLVVVQLLAATQGL